MYIIVYVQSSITDCMCTESTSNTKKSNERMLVYNIIGWLVPSRAQQNFMISFFPKVDLTRSFVLGYSTVHVNFTVYSLC